MKKRAKATVHNLTAARARRGRLSWSCTVDLAADSLECRINVAAVRPTDAIALAESAERWSRILRRLARGLRAKGVG